jgi:hypothetical protein
VTLQEFAGRCAKLRTAALFGDGDAVETAGMDPMAEVERAGMDPMAEQEFLSSLDFLSLAQRAATRAHYHQARALAQCNPAWLNTQAAK